MAALITVGALLPAQTATASTGGETVPPPPTLSYDLTITGPGCGSGVTVGLSPSKDEFAFGYRDMVARAGVGARPGEERRACQIDMRLHYPANYTYAIGRADWFGSALIPAGATAVHRGRVYFPGTIEPQWPDYKIIGPFNDYFTYAKDSSQHPNYLPCGEKKILNIDTALSINMGTADPKTKRAEIATGEWHAGEADRIRIVWKQC